MKTLSLLVTLSMLAACGVEPAPTEAPAPELGVRRDAVLGGATTFEDPEIFYILISYPGIGRFACSSTLINERTLLTAAHCIAPDDGVSPEWVRATNVVDTADAGPSATSPNWYHSAAMRSHPGYTGESDIANDVGVVVLQKAPPVKPRKINTELMEDKVGRPLRAAGYGITSTGGVGGGIKRSVVTDLYTVELGVLRYGREDVIGTCSGDSGGPNFMTFPEGERVIGVNSFHKGGCGRNGSARVDRFDPLIDGWIAELDTPLCTADGRCKAGCTPTADLDCDCIADAACNAACSAAEKDPDCAESCAGNGVCSTTACTTADPDCQPIGAPCGIDDHCAGRKCINDPQHRHYCSKGCATAADCPAEMVCTGGACTHKQLPEAEKGAACTPGAIHCKTPGTLCAALPDTTERCEVRCIEDDDCGESNRCKASTSPGIKVCVQYITLPKLGTVYPPPKGCSSVPAASLLSLVMLLLGVARRRRT